MKAIVLEKKNDTAAVLKDDGTVVKMRHCSYEVGERFEYRKGLSLNKPLGAMIGAMAAVVLMAYGGNYYYNVQAYSYVTLDATSSIEYTLNRRNIVTSVTALNEEAEAVVEQLDIAGKPLSEAMEETFEVLSGMEYLTGSDGYVLVSVQSKDQNRQTGLKNDAENCLAKLQENGTETVIVEASDEDRREAKDLGISTGRYEIEHKEQMSEPPADETVEEQPQEEAPAAPENTNPENGEPENNMSEEAPLETNGMEVPADNGPDHNGEQPGDEPDHH